MWYNYGKSELIFVWGEIVMIDNNMDKLHRLVYGFREAIDLAILNRESGIFFRDFPTGQCGNTSDTLSQYLIDNGFNHITYVNGTYYGDEFENRYSHAWLVVNRMIVDITGDQFKYHPAPLTNNTKVYIGPMNDFFRSFEVESSGKCHHIGLQQQWSNYQELLDIYHTILQYL